MKTVFLYSNITFLSENNRKTILLCKGRPVIPRCGLYHINGGLYFHHHLLFATMKLSKLEVAFYCTKNSLKKGPILTIKLLNPTLKPDYICNFFFCKVSKLSGSRYGSVAKMQSNLQNTSSHQKSVFFATRLQTWI